MDTKGVCWYALPAGAGRPLLPAAARLQWDAFSWSCGGVTGSPKTSHSRTIVFFRKPESPPHFLTQPPRSVPQAPRHRTLLIRTRPKWTDSTKETRKQPPPTKPRPAQRGRGKRAPHSSNALRRGQLLRDSRRGRGVNYCGTCHSPDPASGKQLQTQWCKISPGRIFLFLTTHL